MNKLILTFSATSLFIFFYLMKEQICVLSKYPLIVNLILYLLFVILLAIICLLLMYFGRNNPQEEEILHEIIEIEYADHVFLPVYLGYCFVALSLPSVNDNGWLILCVTYGVIFMFTFFTRTMCYNPLFLLFGYQFYIVKNKDNVRIGLITRKALKHSPITDIPVYRVTDYVCWEGKNRKE